MSSIIKYLITALLAVILLFLSFIYSGLYPVGADNQHNTFTFWVLQTLRTKSIAHASADIVVPPLNAPQLLLSGGADYNDMCAGCHLKPGQLESDMSLGLYPKPPNLTLVAKEHGHAHNDAGHADQKALARQQYWVIKHGVMASGMAAFGATHDDDRIWAMVAFLEKLPKLTPDQYQIITARQ